MGSLGKQLNQITNTQEEEKLKQQQLEQEKKEQERLQKEQEKQQKLEQQRLEQEKKEQERLQKEQEKQQKAQEALTKKMTGSKKNFVEPTKTVIERAPIKPVISSVPEPIISSVPSIPEETQASEFEESPETIELPPVEPIVTGSTIVSKKSKAPAKLSPAEIKSTLPSTPAKKGSYITQDDFHAFTLEQKRLYDTLQSIQTGITELKIPTLAEISTELDKYIKTLEKAPTLQELTDGLKPILSGSYESIEKIFIELNKLIKEKIDTGVIESMTMNFQTINKLIDNDHKDLKLAMKEQYTKIQETMKGLEEKLNNKPSIPSMFKANAYMFSQIREKRKNGLEDLCNTGDKLSSLSKLEDIELTLETGELDFSILAPYAAYLKVNPAHFSSKTDKGEFKLKTVPVQVIVDYLNTLVDVINKKYGINVIEQIKVNGNLVKKKDLLDAYDSCASAILLE